MMPKSGVYQHLRRRAREPALHHPSSQQPQGDIARSGDLLFRCWFAAKQYHHPRAGPAPRQQLPARLCSSENRISTAEVEPCYFGLGESSSKCSRGILDMSPHRHWNYPVICKFAHIGDIGLQRPLLLISITSNPKIWTMWGRCCKVQLAAVILCLIGQLSLPHLALPGRVSRTRTRKDSQV